jgi:VCBS repeat-containing protein
MMISAKPLNSSAFLNNMVFNTDSHSATLNQLNNNFIPVDSLQDGLILAQSKAIGCELLVVFDARVPDLSTLLKAVVEEARCYVLPEDEDAILVITQLLAETGAKRLALVAHGEPGLVNLGAYPLNQKQLQMQSRLLQEWGVEEIALYSCEVAKGDGLAFIYQLSELTGAKIAASSTHIGSSQLGGDWDLTVTLGNPNPSLIFEKSLLQSFQQILAIAISGFTESVYFSGLPSSTGLTIDPLTKSIFVAGMDTNGTLRRIDPSRVLSIVTPDFTPASGFYPYVATDIQFANGFVYTTLSDGSLVRINVSTGTSQILTTFPGVSIESGLDIQNNKIYVTDGEGPSNQLLEFDLSTGISTVKISGLPPSAYGFEYNPTQNKFYFAANGNSFYKADPQTGTYQLLSTAPSGVGNFAIDPTGNFLYARVASDILRISTTNGSYTTFQTGLSGDSLGDLAFGPSSLGNGSSLYIVNGSSIIETSGFPPLTLTPQVPALTLSAANNPIEGGSNGTFTINLDAPAPVGGLVVNFTTSGSTATGTIDYAFIPGNGITVLTANTFTIAAGATSATLNVVAVADAVFDPNETIILNLAKGSGYILGASTSATFTPPINFIGGTPVVSMTTGDFNGDGKLDLAVVNPVIGNISVLLGNGFGGVLSSNTFSSGGTAPGAMTVGDFNGDGKLDLAVANQASSNISVLLGNGSGGLLSPNTFFNGGVSLSAMTAGDFNSDGKLDLVVANQASNDISVLLGNGFGGLMGSSTFSSGGFTPSSVATGDFNGDGKLDLVVTNQASNNISVLLGNGFGGLMGSSTFSSGGFTPSSIATGDFNSDGKLDLAVANQASNDISVLLGNGFGGLMGSSTFSSGGITPRSVTVGDFNGDGKLDLVVANQASNNISVLIGNGFGGLSSPNILSSGGGGPTSVVAGDFDGSGKLDVVVANQASNNISVLLNNSIPTATLTIINNTAPTLQALAPGSYTDTPVNDIFPPLAGTLVGSDLDAGTTLTYGITGGTVSGTTSTRTSAYGTLTLNTLTRAYTYTPNATAINALSSNVSDSFVFTVSDGLLSATQSFTVNITGANDTPTLAAITPSSYIDTSVSNTFSNITGTLAGADRDSGQTLLYGIVGGTVVSGISTSVGIYGTLNLNISTGAYTFTPNATAINSLPAGSNPTASFSVTVSDGSLSTQKVLIVNLTGANDTPTGVASATLTAGVEDTTYTITVVSLLQGFTDVEGDTLSVTGLAATNGSLVNNSNGSYTFTPAANFNGTVNLSYNVVDGNGGSVAATQSFNIAAVNDAPTGTATASLASGTEDTSYTINVADLLVGFTDGDGDTLSISDLSATNGALVNNNDGTYLFIPVANYNGTVDLSYSVVDGNGGSVAATQSFNIAAVNDAPVAVAAVNAITEDFSITGSVSGTDVDTGETTTLTYALVGSVPTGLIFNSDGTYSFDASSYDSLADGVTQSIIIPFTATDVNGATSAPVNLVITITGTNDTPVATSAVNTVLEDAVITGSVSATDADTGAVLTYALVNAAPTSLTFNNDGTYSFDASSYNSLAAGQTQVLDIAFTATDGIATSAPVNLVITITGNNDFPVAVASSNTANEDSTITGSVSATDADTGAVLTYALVNPAPTGLTFNNDGTYSFDASSYNSLAAGQTQVLDIAFTATDGIATSTAENLTITITGTNDTAIIIGTSTGSVLESGTNSSGTPIATGDLNATDVDNTSDTWTAVSTATTSTNGYGTYTLTASGLWAYTLNNTNSTVQALNTGNTLTDTFTVQTIDGTTQTVSITINGTNDAPGISSVSDDTGASSSDRITKDNTLTLTGIAEANSTIQLFNGLTSLGTTTTSNLGIWNLTTSVLSDGIYNLTAKATDAVGNTSAPSAPLSVTVDTSAAAAPTLSLAINSGSSSTDKITNSGIVNVGGLETGANWEYSTNNGTTWTAGTGSNFTLTVDGIKTVVVRQTDLAGNTSNSSAPFTFTLDTTAPNKSATVNTMTLDSGTSATDFLTNNGNAGRIYNGTLSAALTTGESLQISVDGGTTWNNASVSSTTWSFTDNLAKSGNWTIQTRVVDTAGNETLRSKTVTLDRQISAANAVTLDLLASSDSGSSATDNLTNIALSTFAIAFDATKAQAGDIVEVRKGSTVLGSTTLNAAQVSAGIANVTLTTALTNGANTLSAVHRDAAGNSVIGSSTLAVTLDTTAPVAANIIGYTATSIVGTTEPNATVLLSTSAVAPTTFAATATAVANGNYTINTSTLAGSNAGTTHYLYAQDVAGNLSSLNSSQKVIVGTAGADTLINVGSTAGDLLMGGLGTDTAQYAVASNAISLTGQITGTNITSGSINIRTANIDVLTGIETLQFAGSGYSGVGTGANQLRSSVQTALGNNSIAAFTGAYDAATGIFTLGSSPSNNAMLVAFDANASSTTNYETFLLLDKTSIVGGLSVSGGTVTLGL